MLVCCLRRLGRVDKHVRHLLYGGECDMKGDSLDVLRVMCDVLGGKRNNCHELGCALPAGLVRGIRATASQLLCSVGPVWVHLVRTDNSSELIGALAAQTRCFF